MKLGVTILFLEPLPHRAAIPHISYSHVFAVLRCFEQPSDVLIVHVGCQACVTCSSGSNIKPYLCDSQKFALCIVAQVEEEALVACPHDLPPSVCLCDGGRRGPWPYYCSAACD